MKKIFYILFLLSGFAAGQNLPPSIIPLPQQYKFSEAKFFLDNKELQLIIFCEPDEPLKIASGELKNILKEKFQTTLSDRSQKKKILIGLPAENKIYNAVCNGNSILPDHQTGEEGYNLYICQDSILIAANTNKGLFYGVQTLIQMLKGSGNEKILKGIRIKDYPSFNYRGVMDDISRGPVPTVDYMKYQIRRLASMKINLFMHYVEHVVKTKLHPEFVPVDGSLTIEEWKEVAAYAKKYNITLAGSFQSFGHFNKILANPEYAQLGECGTLISPVNPDTYKFLKDIYAEMAPSFTAPFFNINCDETFDLGKGASKKMTDSIGYAGVFKKHILNLYGILKQLGMQTMMWGDIPLLYPELLKSLPKDIIMGVWNYDNAASFEKDISPFAENGFQFFVCPGVLNSNKIFPEYMQTVGNLKNLSRDGAAYKASGVLNTVWDDGGTALFGNDWYGVSLGADKSWNAGEDEIKNFDFRFNKSVYGSDDLNFTKAFWKINELSNLESTDGMNDKILFERLLPDSGKVSRVSLNDWDKVNVIISKTDSLLREAKLNFNADDKDYLIFTSGLYKLLADERFSLIDASLNYKNAFENADRNKSDAAVYLNIAISAINKLKQNYESVKNEFVQLWNRENQPYSLDKIEDKYSCKINAYREIERDLTQLLKNIKEGSPLKPPKDMRLDITKLHSKYFREWLVVNPITVDDGESINSFDYLEAAGGEKNVIPKVTEEFVYKRNKYRWSRITSSLQDKVDLVAEYKIEKGSKATYLYSTIDSPEEQTVNTSFGCAGAAIVYLNSMKVFQASSLKEMTTDEYLFPVKLTKGTNNLMIKLMQNNNGWAFSFSIPESEIRNRKNRYKIIKE